MKNNMHNKPNVSILPLLFVLMTVLANLGSPVLANDGFGALGVGGIIVGRTDQVALEKELLDVRCDLITVNYDFVNESDRDVTSLVVFPLPPYPANPKESGVIAQGQPSGFMVQVGGQPVRFETKVRATVGEKEVTGQLKSIGFSDKQIASFPFDRSLLEDHQLTIPPAQIKKLQEAGLLDRYGGPAWDIHVTYQWMQTFPAKTTVHVMHQYQPFVAIGTDSGYDRPGPEELKSIHEDGRDAPADFCLSQEQQGALDALLADKKHLDGHGEVPGSVVDYILMTANTWKDGVRDFTLRIHAGADDEVVATCYPKGLKRTTSNTYELQIKHFRPEKDLKIYFGNTNRCESVSYGLAPQFKN